MRIKYFFFCCFFSLSFYVTAQSSVAIGQWRTHFNYAISKDITLLGSKVFVAAENTLYYTDLTDNSMHRLGVMQGLNDIGIARIDVNEDKKTLIICYTNSNIDLYYNEFVFNIPDIAKKQISGDKSIYNIFSSDKYAYLACGFGIVVLDIEKHLIKETWYFRENNQTFPVNDITLLADTIYAATTQGIYKNNLNNGKIAQFSSWEKITDSACFFVEGYKDALYAVTSEQFYRVDTLFDENDSTSFQLDSSLIDGMRRIDIYKNGTWEENPIFEISNIKDLSVSSDNLIVVASQRASAYKTDNEGNLYLRQKFSSYSPNTAICDNEGYIWIADNRYGLIRQTPESEAYYSISGPVRDGVWEMDINQSRLAIVHGSHVNWSPEWEIANISFFQNEKWKNMYHYNGIGLSEVYDAFDILFAPYDQSEVFVATYIFGLLQIKDGKVVEKYDQTNSTLQLYADARVQVTSLCFDKDYNLWMANPQTSNPISVRMKNGVWKSFFVPYISDVIGNIFIDSRGWLWMTGDREKSIVIFNNNGTPLETSDDEYIKLNLDLTEETGAFSLIYEIVEDKEGKIWLGTDRGVKVYHNPKRLLSEPNLLPQPIYVEMDGLTELLLNSEIIRCIYVDAGNRKWIGTDNAGVFLLSSDGKEELLHFTTENSPLFSNTITDIKIDEATGEVFIGTDKGLISFRYTATEPKEDYSEIKIFPNPVKEDFDGLISISGLKENSEVKITDTQGGLVYRTKSYGGTATWNGLRFDGRKASTGVYFVLVSDKTGKERKAGKILFIK